jgi:hypothetical protein
MSSGSHTQINAGEDNGIPTVVREMIQALDSYDKDESDYNYNILSDKNDKYIDNFYSFKNTIPKEMKNSIKVRLDKIIAETKQANQAKQATHVREPASNVIINPYIRPLTQFHEPASNAIINPYIRQGGYRRRNKRSKKQSNKSKKSRKFKKSNKSKKSRRSKTSRRR